METKGNNDNYLLAGDKESEDDKKELNVSLEELYQGTIKRVSYERKVNINCDNIPNNWIND